MKSYEQPSVEIFRWEEADVLTLNSGGDPAQRDCEWAEYPFEK